MTSENDTTKTRVRDIIFHPPMMVLWFDADSKKVPNGSCSLWRPIDFLPPIGMCLVPFESNDDWEWEHDDVKVVDYVWMVERNLIVVDCELTRPEYFTDSEVFYDSMHKAGWIDETMENSLWDADASLWDLIGVVDAGRFCSKKGQCYENSGLINGS